MDFQVFTKMLHELQNTVTPVYGCRRHQLCKDWPKSNASAHIPITDSFNKHICSKDGFEGGVGFSDVS